MAIDWRAEGNLDAGSTYDGCVIAVQELLYGWVQTECIDQCRVHREYVPVPEPLEDGYRVELQRTE